MERYFKGYKKDSSEHYILRVFDKPEEDIFDANKKYWGEAERISMSGLTRFESEEDCYKDFYFSHEITEEEWELYKNIQTLTTEMYMNGITGGFPRVQTVQHIAMDMRRLVKDATAAMGAREMSQTEEMFDALKCLALAKHEQLKKEGAYV